MKRVLVTLLILPAILFSISALLPFTAMARSGDGSVVVGLNAEAGHLTSTSDDAIRQGILIAIDEINRGGGVLGGKRMELIVKDNRAVPARAIANNKELAADPKVVAVFCGKFSSAVIESLPLLHELGLPLLDPWAANDKIIENGYTPNFAFRLSLKDSWAIPAMLSYARKRGLEKVGLLLINTSWGRNNLEVIRKCVSGMPGMEIVSTQWVNYGDKSVLAQYNAIRKAGAKAVILVVIESEGSLLVREMAALPADQRLPVVSHWSIAGGDFPSLCGKALNSVDLAFIQTCNLHTDTSAKTQRVLATARRLFNVKSFAEIPSPGGLAHAYDLTHILALAIDKAGSTDRRKIRDALEQVTNYDGLIKVYKQPFTPTRHEALGPENIFMARYRKDGAIQAIR